MSGQGSSAALADAQMRAYYAERAPIYDRVYLQPERAHDIAALSRELPAELAGRRVLEIACGTGYWTQHLAPSVAAMTAVDINAEPMAFARQRPGVDAVHFELADAFALPASLGRFNGAFAGLWFSHVPIERRAAFLAGLHERLEPGARVVFIDNNEAQLRDHPIQERDALGNTFQHRTLPDGSVHRVLKNFPQADELRTLLGAQAREVQFRQLQNFWALSYTWTPHPA